MKYFGAVPVLGALPALVKRESTTSCLTERSHPGNFLTAGRYSWSKKDAKGVSWPGDGWISKEVMNGAVSFAPVLTRPVSDIVLQVLRSSASRRVTSAASRGERFARSWVYLGCENSWKSVTSYSAEYVGFLPSTAIYRAPVSKSGMLTAWFFQ